MRQMTAPRGPVYLVQLHGPVPEPLGIPVMRRLGLEIAPFV